MSKHFALAVAAAVISLAGCRQTAQEPAPAPVMTSNVSEEARQALMKAAPNAVIGKVTHVLPDTRLVRIGDVDVKQFANDDTVLFYGGNEQIVAAGHVVEVKDDSVHVQYAQPGQNQRAPQVGDLAMKFRQEQPANPQ